MGIEEVAVVVVFVGRVMLKHRSFQQLKAMAFSEPSPGRFRIAPFVDELKIRWATMAGLSLPQTEMK